MKRHWPWWFNSSQVQPAAPVYARGERPDAVHNLIVSTNETIRLVTRFKYGRWL